LTQERPQVVIIGAGLAGLSCAVKLSQSGIGSVILEATDRIGGRVRTDIVDGFTLDHGFQVLLTAYPACRELLDYPALSLCAFEPGALIRCRGTFATLGDPWRRPSQIVRTALAKVGTLGDKLRIAKLRRIASRGTLEELYDRDHEPTIQRLHRLGFTEPFIDHFFRPFLGGVLLDPALQTSSRMLEFVFRMFAAGDIAVPSDGMAAIPRQLADQLPRGTIRLGQCVESIHEGTLHLTSGETITPATIVVATESTAAAQIVGVPELETRWQHTVNHYFAAEASPDRRRMLMLAGDEYPPVAEQRSAETLHRAAPAVVSSDQSEGGVIGSVVVLSDIAPQYAPRGRSLISVSTTEPAGYDVSGGSLQRVRDQLIRWYGEPARAWQHLRSYSIPYGLPVQSLRNITPPLAHGNIILCGDYCETPSIQGAMNSGMRAAEIACTL
jgi:phytoene dehydrogenase-like protein